MQETPQNMRQKHQTITAPPHPTPLGVQVAASELGTRMQENGGWSISSGEVIFTCDKTNIKTCSK